MANKKVSIIEAIERSGLKKSRIAEELGISASYYSDFIAHPERMKVWQAEKVCQLLGLNISEVEFRTNFFTQ